MENVTQPSEQERREEGARRIRAEYLEGTRGLRERYRERVRQIAVGLPAAVSPEVRARVEEAFQDVLDELFENERLKVDDQISRTLGVDLRQAAEPHLERDSSRDPGRPG